MLPTSLNAAFARMRPLFVGLVLLFATPGSATLVEALLFAATGETCCGDEACEETGTSGHCPRCHAHGALFTGVDPAFVHARPTEDAVRRAPVFGRRTEALTSLEHKDAPYRPPAA